jgi:hypothetical protein
MNGLWKMSKAFEMWIWKNKWKPTGGTSKQPPAPPQPPTDLGQD